MNEHTNQPSSSSDPTPSTAAGPPALWSDWPASLERATALGTPKARGLSWRSAWSAALWTAVLRCSARIEREPVRCYGVGGAIAFAFGALIGLLFCP